MGEHLMWSIRNSLQPAHFLLRTLLLFLGSVIFLSGCAVTKTMVPAKLVLPVLRVAPFSDVLEASYAAADLMASGLRTKSQKINASIIAASFVNINDLEESCPLGRIVSEQISSRMAQNGFRILDMKLRQNTVYIKERKGEFLLSREIKKISEAHSSGYVIVGTYTVAERSIYICARIVNTTDNSIVTGYDYQLERNFQTESLL